MAGSMRPSTILVSRSCFWVSQVVNLLSSDLSDMFWAPSCG